MTGRFRTVLFDVEPFHKIESEQGYLRVSDDFLAPRELPVNFAGRIYQPETPDRAEIRAGLVRGTSTIHNGVASIYTIDIESDPEGLALPITDHFLDHISMADIGFTIAARCSLTRWQEAHYVVDPIPRGALESALQNALGLPLVLRQLDTIAPDEPRPARVPAKPLLTDADGVPWYQVHVVRDPAHLLSRRPRPRITPDFLRDLWTVYRATRAAGQPTTQTVREWAESRTGRAPSNPTIFRWIQKARELDAQEP